MTVTPEASPQRPRSSKTQMDELDGRLKLLTEDSVAETINDEDSHYTQLRLELERDALNLEAETWSLAVDQSYMKELSKDAVKRQDVIYELMQTEMHHVSTLKVLLYVYKYELKQSALLDDARLDRLFPAVDALLSHHQHFLDGLKRRQEQSQEADSPNNYQICQLGDILVSQFSGSVGEGMKECYSVFCSYQGEATKLYKEQLQNSKKFQNLIKRIGQLPLVRRKELPECFLLVTQRITKYPVLVERLIKNTEADTEEGRSLVQGLSLIKDTIEQVNEQVRENERLRRLREIYLRLEPKSQGRISEDQVFRREYLIQGNRTLLHEGGVQWRTPGRQKDIHAVLLSDVLILLQEKDQKFVFAAMDKAPPVISLQGLIVREVALEDRAMYLICSCTSNMYEIHTASQAERNTWISLIREAVNSFIDEEEPDSEEMAQLQQYQKSLKEDEEQLRQRAEAKQQVCVSQYEAVTGQECPHRGLLLKGDASDLHQGETLLQEALSEVETLQSLFMAKVRRRQSADDLEETNGDSATMNGDVGEGPDADPRSELPFEETVYSHGVERSADGDDTVTPNCTLFPKALPEEDTLLKACERIVLLSQRLNSLQVVLAKQNSQMELLQACQSKSKRSARQGNTLLEQENQRNAERQKQELANLHKMQAQHREEQQRWERERDRQRVQLEVQEAEARQREEQCRQREDKLTEERAELEAQRDSYQQDLVRLLDSQKNVAKDRDKIEQERKKLEKLKKHMGIANPALNVDDPKSLLSFPSFRSGISSVSGVSVRNATARPYTPPPKSDPNDLAPKVPPRRESIISKPAQPYVPIQLRSTTNDSSPALKPGAALQQQIPTKLLEGHSKKRPKVKPSHKRTNSAANIDVREVVPIRVSGKEGGSLRAQRTSSPQRIHKTDLFTPPGPSQNMKPSPSFSSHRRDNVPVPPPAPPVPPPFPKDILDPQHPKEIFL